MRLGSFSECRLELRLRDVLRVEIRSFRTWADFGHECSVVVEAVIRTVVGVDEVANTGIAHVRDK